MLELLAGRPMPLARAVVLLLMVGGPTLAEGYPPSEDRLSAPGDLTFEFRVRDTSREGEVACGEGDGWKGGQVAFDRDFAVSFHEGRVAFGVETDTGSAWTICGEAVVLDGDWHHVAVQRRGSDGWLWIWVDGELDGAGYGPEGSLRSGKRSGPLEGEPFFGLVDDIRRE